MGVVYKGLDPLIQRTVAIKVIRTAAFADDELTEVMNRFRREAQAAGGLIHPNIVTVYEYGEENDSAFIAMEYIEGRSLQELLNNQTSFTLAEVADILSQLLTGLQHAHTSGIVHRDIKPDNLILSADGTLKIMDFGIARLGSSSLTMAGSVMGTPSYMAPELFSGEEIDQRSDLFSAGIILYQLLTGCKPFSGSSLTAIMHQVVNIMPTKPSMLDNRLPAPLDRLIQTSLAKNQANRFQTGADFLATLKDAFSKVDTSLVTQTAISMARSNQESTRYERGQVLKRSTAALASMRALPMPIFVGAALVLLTLIAFFIFKDNDSVPLSDSGAETIISNHKKNVSSDRVLKILAPVATKKQITIQPTKARTGIRITTSSSEKIQESMENRSSSRNAISITVPDRR